jgi:DNA-binding NarL/FixJ family response regulator
LERGRPDEAAVALERAHALSTRSEDETLLPELCMWSARAIADQHQRADAAERVAEGASRRARADELLATVTHVIDSREHRGATATARQLAAAAQTASERSRLGRSDAELWARAAQLWAQAHEAYPEAYCRWREAEAVMEGRGARAQALAALEAAHAIAQRLEARPLLDRISQLAQRGRLELRAADVCEPSPAAQAAEALGLTPREVEVLGLLADGRSDRDIASALFISRKTVSVHVSNVLRKLAVSRRFEAARIGQAHGLGTATPSIQTLATPGE